MFDFTNMTLRLEYFGGIIYNNYGNMVFLNEIETNKIKQFIEGKERLSFDVLEILLKQGFITNKQSRGSLRIINALPSPNFLSAPISVHYYPSYICNQKCKFCYNPKNNKEDVDKTKIMVTAQTIIDKCKEMGVVIFNILGGEPLCYFDIVLDILKKASPHFFCSFATNGSANGGVTEDMAKELSRIPNIDIRVSLHSNNPHDHNNIVNDPSAFDTAIKSIKTLVKYNVNCRISCVPTMINYSQVFDMIDLAKKLGAKGFHLLPLHMTHSFNNENSIWLDNTKQKKLAEQVWHYRSNDDFEVTSQNWFYNVENYEKIKKYVGQPLCVAGYEIAEIDPEGDVYPCNMVLGNREYCMGNILNDSFRDIWHSSKFDFLRNRNPDLIIEDKCKKCGYVEYCKGGCPFENQLVNNDINYGSTLCPF